MRDRVLYQFEYAERVRCAFIGAGGHSYRNVYPALQYAPVDLVAVCDVQAERATTYARTFGASAHYSDYREMLERERPDAVFIVTAYDKETGRPQATDIALDCLRAGVHVWSEKPVAASVADVRELRQVADEAGRSVLTGVKKVFTPALEKAKAIATTPEFGGLTSISVRYPQDLPPLERRHDLTAMRGFLDHIYHPAAVLAFIAGPVERFSYEWTPTTGASVATLRFTSGTIGTLHLAAGIAGSSPLERVELIGQDANVVVDNGVRVSYYRPGARREYGRAGSFLVADDAAPLVWEPEFSLGQLYNKNLFYLGYVPEILEFCRAILDKRPPRKGTLDDILEIMRLYEAYQNTPPGTVVTLTGKAGQ